MHFSCLNKLQHLLTSLDGERLVNVTEKQKGHLEGIRSAVSFSPSKATKQVVTVLSKAIDRVFYMHHAGVCNVGDLNNTGASKEQENSA